MEPQIKSVVETFGREEEVVEGREVVA